MKELRALLLEAQGLKALSRAGWVRAGVPQPESVAAHSWGMAFLSLVLCPPELNRERVLALTIVHDLAEVRVGDITPYDGISKKEKHQREQQAAHNMLTAHPELLGLWEEYEAQQTAEARFVHLIDRMDMALQAQAYQQDHAIDLSEFIQSARKTLADALNLVELLD